MIRDLMVQQARLALEAFGAGDLARYAMHQGNARRLADHLALQESQERRQREPQFRPDFGIEGPRHADADFLKKDNALSAGLRWLVRPIAIGACIGTALFFIGRAAGLF